MTKTTKKIPIVPRNEVVLPEKVQELLHKKRHEAVSAMRQYQEAINKELQRTTANILEGFMATLNLEDGVQLQLSDDMTKLIENGKGSTPAE